MSGRPTAAQVRAWADEVTAVGDRIGRHFARSGPRARAVGYIRGLLSQTERKNGWQLAEHLGDATPDGVQHLLARADWDADAVRDDLLGYVAERLGDPTGVLVVDETGFLKKGTKSCGAARQYTGTAGRVENARVGVFLACASPKGHALIDRALHLPKEWTDDRPRCDAAGVPEGAGLATKPRLAEGMLRRAWRAGVAAGWVTGDAVYGSDGAFRRFLEQGKQPYVLAVRSDQRLWVDLTQVRVDAIAAGLPAGAWHRASPGRGRRGRGGTTGRSRHSARPTTGGGSSGCWSGGTGTGRTSGRTTCAGDRPGRRGGSWSGSPAAGGRWNIRSASASRRPG